MLISKEGILYQAAHTWMNDSRDESAYKEVETYGQLFLYGFLCLFVLVPLIYFFAYFGLLVIISIILGLTFKWMGFFAFGFIGILLWLLAMGMIAESGPVHLIGLRKERKHVREKIFGIKNIGSKFKIRTIFSRKIEFKNEDV